MPHGPYRTRNCSGSSAKGCSPAGDLRDRTDGRVWGRSRLRKLDPHTFDFRQQLVLPCFQPQAEAFVGDL
jgi:hypothetical protein